MGVFDRNAGGRVKAMTLGLTFRPGFFHEKSREEEGGEKYNIWVSRMRVISCCVRPGFLLHGSLDRQMISFNRVPPGENGK